MSASGGDSLDLSSSVDSFGEGMVGEDAIVRPIFLDVVVVFEAILFIASFAGDGFNGIGAFLEAKICRVATSTKRVQMVYWPGEWEPCMV